MSRKIGHAIHDILEAIERVEQITRHKTLTDFETVGSCVGLCKERSRSSPKQAVQFPTT